MTTKYQLISQTSGIIRFLKKKLYFGKKKNSRRNLIGSVAFMETKGFFSILARKHLFYSLYYQ